jgi:hypothetical protein
MTTRRTLFAAAPALVASLAAAKSALAQAAQEPAKQADFLFVQTAKGMTFDKSTSKLTLNGVSPVTVMFSDRPERIAANMNTAEFVPANMNTAEFVPFWSKGKDSFLSDPPNADLSITESDNLRQFVVVLQDPVLRGDNLTYTIKVLQGDMPATGSDVSVFIDIIGMPRTPLSFAGVDRRHFRRAFYRR